MVKRVFWSDVSVESCAGALYRVTLDNRALTLPGGTPLAERSKGLVEAIAEEWRTQRKGAIFSHEALPLTQLVATQHERVAKNRPDIIATLVNVFHTDTLLFRAGDDALGRLQTRIFSEARKLFEHDFSITLPWAETVASPTFQPEDMRRISAKFEGCTDPVLTGLSVAASLTASAILAYAIVQNFVSPEQAVEIAHVEENAQMLRWGRDPSMTGAQSRQLSEFASIQRYLRLVSA